MRKFFILMLTAMPFIMSSCQSDDFTNGKNVDETIVTNDTTSHVKTLRLYPTNVTERSSNSIYVDFEPNDRQILMYIESETMSASRIAANYNIEVFVAEDFHLLKEAFYYIESYNKDNGKLYFVRHEDGDAWYPVHYDGYQAEYSKAKVEPTILKLTIDKVYHEPLPSNVATYFILPTRIKVSHKNGGPTYIYDINLRFDILGSNPVGTWRLNSPF